MKYTYYILLAAVVLCVSGCSVQSRQTGHANVNNYQRVHQIKEGVTTREQVAALLSTAYDRNVSKTWEESRNAQGEEVWKFSNVEGKSTSGFFNQASISSLVITFDENGIVKKKEYEVKSRSSGSLDVFRDDFSLIPYKEELPF